MSSLSSLGLGLYELLPDYRDRCPLCRGSECAVRHGLYFRCLVDEEGRTYQRFPVARFRCRRRGPDQPRDVTFSVLPAQVVPRRRFSLGLMSWMVEVVVNGKRTMRQALDEVATAGSQGEEAVLLEELTLHRMLLLLAAVYGRLLSFPVAEVELPGAVQGVRRQAQQVAALLAAQPRGFPPRVVLRFHRRYFPHLLFDLRLALGPRSGLLTG